MFCGGSGSPAVSAGGSGKPYWEGIHYDLVQNTMWVFFREARRVLRLRIETDGPTPDAHPGVPILVACRHAGPGDSFTLIHALMHWYAREPRVVLKDTLAWDPMIDVLLRRIPARFITPNPGAGQDLESQIADLARGLDENDAFVIFPEGGNFTPRRRQRGIDRLRKLGMERMAERAEAMTNVLAPRPGGFIAALDAAPDADVVLVAHTGLDHMLTVGDVWRELPMDKQLVMRWWQVPARTSRPTGRADRVAVRLVGGDRRWIEQSGRSELIVDRPASATPRGAGRLLLALFEVDDRRPGRRASSRGAGPRRRRRAPRRGTRRPGPRGAGRSAGDRTAARPGSAARRCWAAGSGCTTTASCRCSSRPGASWRRTATPPAMAANSTNRLSLPFFFFSGSAPSARRPSRRQPPGRGGLLGGEGGALAMIGAAFAGVGERRGRLRAGVGDDRAGLLAGVVEGGNRGVLHEVPRGLDRGLDVRPGRST